METTNQHSDLPTFLSGKYSGSYQNNQKNLWESFTIC